MRMVSAIIKSFSSAVAINPLPAYDVKVVGALIYKVYQKRCATFYLIRKEESIRLVDGVDTKRSRDTSGAAGNREESSIAQEAVDGIGRSVFVDKSMAWVRKIWSGTVAENPFVGKCGRSVGRKGAGKHIGAAIRRNSHEACIRSIDVNIGGGGTGEDVGINFDTFSDTSSGRTGGPATTIRSVDNGGYSGNLQFLTANYGDSSNEQSVSMGEKFFIAKLLELGITV